MLGFLYHPVIDSWSTSVYFMCKSFYFLLYSSSAGSVTFLYTVPLMLNKLIWNHK